MSSKKKPAARRRKNADPLDDEFGPGVGGEGPPPEGPFATIACGGEGCFLKPVAGLVSRFALGVVKKGHGPSLGRAASSGIEMMKAMRDFLDEEIALAERAAGRAKEGAPRVEKIPVE